MVESTTLDTEPPPKHEAPSQPHGKQHEDGRIEVSGFIWMQAKFWLVTA